MKKWQKILLWLFVIALLGFGIMKGYLYYLNNKPHRDVTKEQGIAVTAEQIFNDFTTNEAAANQKYLNKAIEVSGEVVEAKKNQDSSTVVVLKTADPVFGVNCTFKKDPGAIQPGNRITFKGICTGFISDVVINEGVLLKK
jgi:predicted negative regulator of RcsB-dependent stress response